MQKTIYRNLLNRLEKSNYRNRSQNLCCFSAQKGSLYNNNLMVVGRAVNDWGNIFQLEDIQSDSLLEELFPGSPGHDCPLEWVESSWGSSEGYNTKRSAFWRVANKISQSVNQLEDNELWASKIVWSNLYKVAPSGGGNPNDSLCDLQFNACNDLLKIEVEEFRPKYIVFLTGQDWFNGFLSENISLNSITDTKWVDAQGILELNGSVSKFVVAQHPQGKPESELLKEIVNALAKV